MIKVCKYDLYLFLKHLLCIQTLTKLSNKKALILKKITPQQTWALIFQDDANVESLGIYFVVKLLLNQKKNSKNIYNKQTWNLIFQDDFNVESLGIGNDFPIVPDIRHYYGHRRNVRVENVEIDGRHGHVTFRLNFKVLDVEPTRFNEFSSRHDLFAGNIKQMNNRKVLLVHRVLGPSVLGAFFKQWANMHCNFALFSIALF